MIRMVRSEWRKPKTKTKKTAYLQSGNHGAEPRLKVKSAVDP